MTQTGATGKGTTGVGTGSNVKSISTAVWATALLQKLKVPVTANNIQNIQRMIQVESAGNQAGFLRDNNPFNLNTGASPHGNLYPGGSIVQEFGIYVQTFNSVEAGITATAGQVQLNPSLFAALKNNASPAMFGGALSTSAWKSGSYANAQVFPTITPYNGMGAVGGQGLTWSASKGAAAVVSAGKDVGKVAAAVASPVVSVGKFLGDLTNPTYLKNVGIFALGFVLVASGTVLLFASTKTAKGVESTAAKAL